MVFVVVVDVANTVVVAVPCEAAVFATDFTIVAVVALFQIFLSVPQNGYYLKLLVVIQAKTTFVLYCGSKVSLPRQCSFDPGESSSLCFILFSRSLSLVNLYLNVIYIQGKSISLPLSFCLKLYGKSIAKKY